MTEEVGTLNIDKGIGIAAIHVPGMSDCCIDEFGYLDS
jgi:hypothetical protein